MPDMAEQEKKVLKKRIITLAVAVCAALTLASCGQNIAEEAAEKGRAYFDSGDYETAAKAFMLSVENGNTEEEINRLYDITLKYCQANKAYDEKKFSVASEILEKIDKSYENYGIKDKITTLKSKIEDSCEAERLLEEVSERLTAGDYAAAVASAEKIDVTLLSPTQTDRLNEYKTSIAQAQAAEAERAEQERVRAEAEKAKKQEAQKEKKTAEKKTGETKTTEEKTASAKNQQTAVSKPTAPAINVNVSNDAYIYPTDTVLLTAEQLKTLNRAELSLIRNEIYARKGHVFTKDQYISYFSGKTWYQAKGAVLWTDLNEIEKANIKLLKEYEAKA